MKTISSCFPVLQKEGILFQKKKLLPKSPFGKNRSFPKWHFKTRITKLWYIKMFSTIV
jgi:hypothetical protein